MHIINVAFAATGNITLFYMWMIFAGSMVTSVSTRVFLSLFREKNINSSRVETEDIIKTHQSDFSSENLFIATPEPAMDGSSNKEIVNGLNNLFALHCCLVSVTSLLVYDSLLCLSDEVSLVWLSGLRGNSGKKKSSILRYLYVTSRLLAFLLCFTVLYTAFPISVKRDIWLKLLFIIALQSKL
ncbi:hypothetical protein PNOK_0645600 [Pyrrhoderma noxium]|uniref:DUF6533 domain-containing protein n=1 Tax=Pyrrhoderma noxium TaxID=2282107 RepID=A0A286UEF2_9AGAM|nr:hypothetical protein PNOK_0645600 [Pyrrhoderma noxium]